jgi:energy-coupling factor transport system ATP-binding protein
MSEALVRMEAFSYRYPGAERAALSGVNLEIEPGEFVVLAGRSGSGKTTVLHACCGLVPHYHGGDVSGELVVTGLDVASNGPAELGGEVGLVAQDPEAQVVASTVRGEIELPLEVRGEGETARARAVEEVALALGIPHLLDRSVDTLSGGELQRVALAAALVGRPRLVLLDEPTSQLDPVSGDELIGLLRRLNEQWGTAIVVSEHRLERCLPAADRLIALRDGGVAFDGAPGDFLDWALRDDPSLATPAATLFDLAGISPLPVGVKDARATLRAQGVQPASSAWLPEPDDQAVSARAPRSWRWRRSRAEDAALSVRDLWVELDDGEALRDVLRGISLRVEPGEQVALMGRNGAGKTTLLRAVAGLTEAARGRAEAPGEIALLPQNPSDLLVRERVSEELPDDAGRDALEAVGLKWAIASDPRDLSGGERQRLALAIAMAGRMEGPGLPRLVCLDEPTRGMDRARKDDLGAWLGQVADTGSAVLVATHDVEFAASFAKRVVLLGQGRVIADGDAEEVLSGGWYFATEVARILGSSEAISPEQGATQLGRLTEDRA